MSGRIGSLFSLSPDRFWLSRHYIALSTLVSVAIAKLSPGSLNAMDLEINGLAGDILVVILTVVASLLLVEAFSTAFVTGVQINPLRRRRHTLLMMLAIGHLSMAYIIVVYAPFSATLALRFGLDAVVAVLVAFLDLFQRHKADRC